MTQEEESKLIQNMLQMMKNIDRIIDNMNGIIKINQNLITRIENLEKKI